MKNLTKNILKLNQALGLVLLLGSFCAFSSIDAAGITRRPLQAKVLVKDTAKTKAPTPMVDDAPINPKNVDSASDNNKKKEQPKRNSAKR